MRLKLIVSIAVTAMALSASTYAQHGQSTDCEDVMDRAEVAASDLASRSRELQQCAEDGGFANDCSAEFHRVGSAHDDYLSAISDVGSYCE